MSFFMDLCIASYSGSCSPVPRYGGEQTGYDPAVYDSLNAVINAPNDFYGMMPPSNSRFEGINGMPLAAAPFLAAASALAAAPHHQQRPPPPHGPFTSSLAAAHLPPATLVTPSGLFSGANLRSPLRPPPRAAVQEPARIHYGGPPHQLPVVQQRPHVHKPSPQQVPPHFRSPVGGPPYHTSCTAPTTLAPTFPQQRPQPRPLVPPVSKPHPPPPVVLSAFLAGAAIPPPVKNATHQPRSRFLGVYPREQLPPACPSACTLRYPSVLAPTRGRPHEIGELDDEMHQC